ncbi:MAG: hypothetical protein K9L32_01095 [Chromatiaceae bacterium]|nr:hypothetical protein [Chromatiaceae bacterium]
MNILLVNPTHPDVKHISAVRAWRFGTELALRGHRVALLTAQPDAQGQSAGLDLDGSQEARVLVMAAGSLIKRNNELLPAPLRRVETLFRMLTTGGYQGAWVKDAVHMAIAQSETFIPDVIWATYGQMETVIVAKRLARHFNIPWVLDLKDNWNLYVPKSIRRLMAWRIQGWSALTANSELTREQGQRWHGTTPALIYSGVSRVFLEDQKHPPGQEDIGTLNLIGGLYFDEPLKVLLGGIVEWAASRTQSQIKLTYYGVDGQRLARVAALVDPDKRLVIHSKGFVDPATLASKCQHAMANAYIGHPGTFHHKTLELLACGRPLIVVPREREESRRLVAQVSGLLLEADTTAAVVAACDQAELDWKHRALPIPNTFVRQFTWPIQTEYLEQVLFNVVST